jgi:hypothetical protein
LRTRLSMHAAPNKIHQQGTQQDTGHKYEKLGQTTNVHLS